MKAWLAAAALLTVADLVHAQSPAPPPTPLPRLELTLKPHATGGADSYLAVHMVLGEPKLSAGETLLLMPLRLVGIPTARYDGDAIVASDRAGPLALTAQEAPPTPQGVWRRWSVGRATVGDVVVDYRAPPRRVTAATNNGPLFDLREESGGFIGAGVGFLALPEAKGARGAAPLEPQEPYHISLKWDLSQAPPGSRGVWSLGDGDVERDVPPETLRFSYYAVGPLKSIPPRGDRGAGAGSTFGLYWLTDPPFDVALLGERIRSLYATMARFFDDTHSSYRVFMRQNPFEGTGGSALAHSFMFGYRAEDKPTVDKLQGLLAHEMTHNWPAMEGEHGDTAWYSEGTAEYYSLLFSHRGGQLSTDRFVDELNEKAAAYYTNPYIHLSNPAAAKIFWTDPIAQTVPYGRGLLYLILTDAEIRASSHGRHSLDDIVRELYRRETRQEPYGIPQWLELVGRELGTAAAQRDYEHMVSGGIEEPAAARFAPCLRVVRRSTRAFQLGFARASLNDARIVRELEPQSAAAKAGVRNGDTIVDVQGMLKARQDEAMPLTLGIRRDGAFTYVTYLPRGERVPGYAWERNPAAPESSCKF